MSDSIKDFKDYMDGMRLTSKYENGWKDQRLDQPKLLCPYCEGPVMEKEGAFYQYYCFECRKFFKSSAELDSSEFIDLENEEDDY